MNGIGAHHRELERANPVCRRCVRQGGRASWWTRTNHSLDSRSAQNLAQRQRAGARALTDYVGSNSLHGKRIVPEGLTNNRLQTVEPALQVCGTSRRREVQESPAMCSSTGNECTNGRSRDQRRRGGVEARAARYASLLMSTNTGTEAQSILHQQQDSRRQRVGGLEATRSTLRSSIGAGDSQDHAPDIEAPQGQDCQHLFPY